MLAASVSDEDGVWDGEKLGVRDSVGVRVPVCSEVKEPLWDTLCVTSDENENVLDCSYVMVNVLE